MHEIRIRHKKAEIKLSQSCAWAVKNLEKNLYVAYFGEREKRNF
jgi:hypothetical protein